MHKQVFRIVPHNLEYVKTHCIDLNIPFHFSFREW